MTKQTAFVSVLRDDVRTLLGALASDVSPWTLDDRDRLVAAVRRIEIELSAPTDRRLHFSTGEHPPLE